MNQSMKKFVFGSVTTLTLFTSIAPAVTNVVTTTANASSVTNLKKQAGKQIKLTGAVNVRDLGGYTNRKGQTIKAKRLIRSAQLNKLTKSDIKKLTEQYHVAVDVDFRTPKEVAKANDPKIKGVKYVKAPVVSDKENEADIKVFNKDGEKGMILYYTYFINKTGRKEYRKLFNELLKVPDNKAVLYHCSYGKDRTGFATALILTALGFDKQTIYKDYLLSNKYRSAATKADLAAMKKNGASKKELKNEYYNDIVEKQYLDKAYSLAEKKYGSMMGYLKQGLGLTNTDIQKLQSKYLTKAK
ncbi:tyrosine-protein phosphatase [Nicoliella spurrieriana]|uniref:Tyrosine-protein phosphatase n=1 Tax=Nicoliella spurrieriana TaxID=2925830 RepID=A0A976RSY4_9LACO|nr:tyrosine-protein phosphatase [Nicoliella spurrieriana]UQS87292.1 tyrosine-protein phosphatase [Nicoliella spurrieriana]